MQTIKEILGYPDGTPISAVQARLLEVYEYGQKVGDKGPYTIQNVMLADSTGQIRMAVWDHPDMSVQKGGEYVFGGSKGKGLKVKHGTGKYAGKVELSMTRGGSMQFIEVHHAQAGTKPVPSPAKAPIIGYAGGEAGSGAKSPSSPINGAMVGGVLHDVAALVAADMIPTAYRQYDLMDIIRAMAIDLIRLSEGLSSGRIAIEAPSEKPAPTTPPSAEVVDEDRPF